MQATPRRGRASHPASSAGAAVGAENDHMARRILDIFLAISPDSLVILSPSAQYYCHRYGGPASQARRFSNPDRHSVLHLQVRSR